MSANVPLSTVPTQSITQGSAEGERVALARDLADLLMEFSLALGHQSAYPQGHPMLLTAAERLGHTLGAVLAGRETLTLGIAKRQFVINGVATDPRSEFLAKLAQRFHRHRIAAIRLDRGITHGEIGALLQRVSADPRREPGPLGLQPEDARRWTHAQLYPARYEGLELRSDAEPVAPEDGPPGVQLWLELARAALPDASKNGSEGASNPAVLAAAINRHARDETYDETVIGYLLQMADEAAVGESVEQAWLRRRLSRLISALEPAALQRLLDMSGTGLQRRKFVLDASQTLAADAVVKVVEAAAESSQRAISDNLMLLLGKLAHHAESGIAEVATAAEAALRENVSQLLSDWNLQDPNPEAYSSVLRHMAHTAPVQGSDAGEFVLDPEEMLQIGLEIGETGPRVSAAAERLIAEGKTRRLAELIDQAPQEGGAVERLWDHLVTPALLRQALAVQPTDFVLVERFALRLADKAAEPLLDALASADDRSTRWNLIRILTALGGPAAPAIAARLPDAPWFVQRNLLVLLGRLGNWPDEFSPSQYTSHREARVRREAYRLMVEIPSTRDNAIRDGLADPDPVIVAMMLRAAATGCPAAATSMVERILVDAKWSLEVRLLAIRVVAVTKSAGAAEHLLALVRRPRRWLWGSRLAPKSPVLLAALKALAEGWASNPKVVPVLTEAAGHRDPEIRASVGGPGT
jgi:hypothetical protein